MKRKQLIYERDNLRFSTADYRPDDAEDTHWLVNVTRISDGHWITPQVWRNSARITKKELVAIAKAWIESNPTASSEPDKVYCSACKTELKSKWDTNHQFDNCLWIDFGQGGYGMFHDRIGWDEKSLIAVLCHECAHELCDKVDWICGLLKPEHSHTHTQDYHNSHPDHWGPDYE